MPTHPSTHERRKQRATWDFSPVNGGDGLERISRLAKRAACDTRDLEAGLVRLALDHRRVTDCPGLLACVAMTPPGSRGSTD